MNGYELIQLNARRGQDMNNDMKMHNEKVNRK
jgi:hypothetical protein